MTDRTEAPAAMSPLPGRRGEVVAWTMYDWACSVYSTLQITVIVIYMGLVLPDRWGWVTYGGIIAVATLTGAVLSPVVGALADARNNKRLWLAGTALGGSAAAVVMALVPPSMPWLVAALFFVVHVLFEVSYVPYNGFLPEIADEKTMNRVSAWGYGVGYVGGAVPLLIVLMMAPSGDAPGVAPATEAVADWCRSGLLLLGLWWAVFSVPTLLVLRDRGPKPTTPSPAARAVADAFREVGRTLARIRKYRMLALFLLGYLLYNDGMQTIITQASVFAKHDLNMETGDLAMLILAIQFVALPGALVVGWLADRAGQKRVLVGCLVLLTGICVAALWVTEPKHMWVMGLVFALVMGGTQSVSRAIMGRMTPPERSGEFMGFFSFSGRATSFLGAGVFAGMLALTGAARPAIFTLLVFFVLGWLAVSFVNIDQGRRDALGQ